VPLCREGHLERSESAKEMSARMEDLADMLKLPDERLECAKLTVPVSSVDSMSHIQDLNL
jgi:hypothetical protein